MPIGQEKEREGERKIENMEKVEKENLPAQAFTYLYRFRGGIFPIVVDMMKVRHTAW